MSHNAIRADVEVTACVQGHFINWRLIQRVHDFSDALLSLVCLALHDSWVAVGDWNLAQCGRIFGELHVRVCVPVRGSWHAELLNRFLLCSTLAVYILSDLHEAVFWERIVFFVDASISGDYVNSVLGHRWHKVLARVRHFNDNVGGLEHWCFQLWRLLIICPTHSICFIFLVAINSWIKSKRGRLALTDFHSRRTDRWVQIFGSLRDTLHPYVFSFGDTFIDRCGCACLFAGQCILSRWLGGGVARVFLYYSRQSKLVAVNCALEGNLVWNHLLMLGELHAK